MLKTYQSLKYIEYHLVLRIKDKNVTVDFTGGSSNPVLVKGKLTTTDRNIQKALESHPRFGLDFHLIYSEKDPIKEKLEDVSRKVQDVFGEAIEVKGIRSIQEAKEFLTAKHPEIKEETLNDVNKVFMLIEKYNYSFPDLVH